jgi:hypothetical protein
MQLSNPAVVDANWTRETEGQGTHMLSTTVDSFVSRASLFGSTTGTAKAARRGRVSVECTTAAVLPGFEFTIHGGATSSPSPHSHQRHAMGQHR